MLLIILIGKDRTIVLFLFFVFLFVIVSQKLHIYFVQHFLAFREDCTFWNVVPDSAFTSFRMFQCKCTPDTQPKTVSRMLYSLIFTLVIVFIVFVFAFVLVFVNVCSHNWKNSQNYSTFRYRQHRVGVAACQCGRGIAGRIQKRVV